MTSFLTRHAETIIVAMVTAAVMAAAPAVASNVTNADKVDGFDAVGCKASTQHRAGKLVAVCPNGYLPRESCQRLPKRTGSAGCRANPLPPRPTPAGPRATTFAARTGAVSRRPPPP